MKLAYFIFFVISIQLAFCACGEEPAVTEAFKVISGSKQHTVKTRAAMWLIERKAWPPEEKPDFWLKIINNLVIENSYRADCIFLLFHRHAIGKSLVEIADWRGGFIKFDKNTTSVHAGVIPMGDWDYWPEAGLVNWEMDQHHKNPMPENEAKRRILFRRGDPRIKDPKARFSNFIISFLKPNLTFFDDTVFARIPYNYYKEGTWTNLKADNHGLAVFQKEETFRYLNVALSVKPKIKPRNFNLHNQAEEVLKILRNHPDRIKNAERYVVFDCRFLLHGMVRKMDGESCRK